MNLLRLIVLISVACLALEHVTAANKLRQRVKALEQVVDTLNSNVKALTSNTQGLNQGSAVAFSSYIDASTPLSSKTIFNKVLVNEHQAYNQSTGVFTCPISGIYMFSFVAAVRGTGTTWAELKVGGNATLHAITEGAVNHHDLQGVNIVIVKLSKDDEVWISGKGTLPGNSNRKTSSFSGFLIQPTTD